MNRIAVIAPNYPQYSETFINAHIQNLAGNIHVLHSGYLPTQYSQDKGANQHNLLLPNRWKYKFTKDQRSLSQKAVRHYLLRNNIQVVLAEYGPSGVEMLDICKKTNIPLIVHFHGFDAYRDDVLNFYGKQYDGLFDYASAVIGVSQDMIEQLNTIGCPKEKLQLIRYGVDTSLFHPASPPSKRENIVACGRFVSKKAPYLTILAFHNAWKKRPSLNLSLIGDGELMEVCKTIVASLNLQDHVTFEGVLSPENVSDLMRNSAIFIQSSMLTKDNDSEGTPVAILEAMATGLPIVATNHGGIPEVIEDGMNGFIVAEKSIFQMSQAIIRLIDNPDLYMKIRTANIIKVQEYYSRERNIKALDLLIKNMLN